MQTVEQLERAYRLLVAEGVRQESYRWPMKEIRKAQRRLVRIGDRIAEIRTRAEAMGAGRDFGSRTIWQAEYRGHLRRQGR